MDRFSAGRGRYAAKNVSLMDKADGEVNGGEESNDKDKLNREWRGVSE